MVEVWLLQCTGCDQYEFLDAYAILKSGVTKEVFSFFTLVIFRTDSLSFLILITSKPSKTLNVPLCRTKDFFRLAFFLQKYPSRVGYFGNLPGFFRKKFPSKWSHRSYFCFKRKSNRKIHLNQAWRVLLGAEHVNKKRILGHPMSVQIFMLFSGKNG